MEEEFDIVIIGSGLGGLQSAFILADEGYKVCILEKNRQFGGNLQTFVRDKKIFDTGVHYIGGLDEGQNLNKYFHYFELMEELKLKKLDENAFDLISFDNDENVYPYAQGYENFIEQLVKKFPDDRNAIIAFCNKIREVVNHFPMYNLQPATLDEEYLDSLEVGLVDYLKSITSNEKLQNVLAGNNLLYAGRASTTPLYVHALVLNSYIESSYRCVGGGSQIERILSKNLRKRGVVLKNYAEVTSINIGEDKLVESVTINHSENVKGKKFISNIHPRLTLELIEEQYLRKSYRKRIKSLNNTTSIFIIYGIFKEKYFKHINSNIYHYASNNVWDSIEYKVGDFGESFALFFSQDEKNPDYSESFSLMTYMHYDEVKKWEDSFHTIPKHKTDRGEEYIKFKEEKADILLQEVEKRIAGFKGNIESFTTSTPLSFRDYIGTYEGSLYGIEKDYNNALKTFIPAQTKVKNLLLTGQNLNLHGILGVTISAFITCSEIVDLSKLIDKINNQKK